MLFSCRFFFFTNVPIDLIFLFHSLTWMDLRGTTMSSDNLLKLLLPENLLAIFIQKNKIVTNIEFIIVMITK